MANRHISRLACLCQHCGAGFSVTPSKRKAGRGRFCSRRCSAIFNHRGRPKPHSRINLILANEARRLKGFVPWNKNPQSAMCVICARPYSSTLSLLRGGRQCCSWACRSRLMALRKGPDHPLWKPKAQRLCEWCGAQFETKPAKVAYGEGRFCSRQCVGSWTTSNHPRSSSLETSVAMILNVLNEPFEAQKQLGPWIVDFFLPCRRIVIECDGAYWHSLPQVIKRDRQKDGWLWRNNYRLLRLPEARIRTGMVKGDIVGAFA